MYLVASIVLAAIILFYLRTAVIALNAAEHDYIAFVLVVAVALVCLAVLQHEARYLPTIGAAPTLGR